MEIIKSENGIITVQATFPRFESSEEKVMNDLHEFIVEKIDVKIWQGFIDKFRREDAMEDTVTFRFRFYGQEKPPVDEFVKCVEFMISNL